jgi:Protein of unknown function (DUF2752)
VPLTVPVADGPLPAWLDRLLAALTVATAVLAVVVLWRVVPDPRGFDTHVQLGLAPCSWPLTLGIPCPTCGCTTAACHFVHGHLLQAVATQPFGAAAALVGLLVAGFCAFCLVRGRSATEILGHVPWVKVSFWTLVLLLGSWLYKYLTFQPA